jgi:hypothetical protein
MMFRCLISIILGMRSMTGGGVSMMPGTFVVIVLVMLCGFGVMLGCLFVVFRSLLVMGCALMVRHFSLLLSSRRRECQRGH